jgi:hypothetical protein
VLSIDFAFERCWKGREVSLFLHSLSETNFVSVSDKSVCFFELNIKAHGLTQKKIKKSTNKPSPFNTPMRLFETG